MDDTLKMSHKGFRRLFLDEELDPKVADEMAEGVPWSIGELRILTETTRWTIDVVRQIFQNNQYKLHPEYQRRRRWETSRRSRLIESLILNVPVPPIFLYETKASEYEVMDGLQRLTTVLDYYADLFELTGAEILTNLNGLKYSALPRDVSRQLDRAIISATILLAESTRDDAHQSRMKQLVFERINTGGIKLSEQEIRNALMGGPMNKLCVALSLDASYRRCWGWTNLEPPGRRNKTHKKEPPGSEETRNMKDVEYVLRFLALPQRRKFEKLSLGSFLDVYMRSGNKFSSATIQELQQHFTSTFALVDDIFGQRAFLSWKNGKYRKRSSPVMYDAISQGFSATIGFADRIREKRVEVGNAIRSMLESKESEFKASYGNPLYVAKRVGWIEEAIRSVVE